MDLEPQDVKTLDPGDTRVITWSRIRDLMTAPSPPDEPGGYFPSYLSTVRPNGRRSIIARQHSAAPAGGRGDL